MVHQYKLNGCNIVVDAHSGAIHAVDDVAYDIIALYKALPEEALVDRIMAKYGERPDVTPEDIRACLADIAALEQAREARL